MDTKHDLALKEKEEYNRFYDALTEIAVPPSLRRWYNEAVLENFGHTFEEILAYGDTYGEENA